MLGMPTAVDYYLHQEPKIYLKFRDDYYIFLRSFPKCSFNLPYFFRSSLHLSSIKIIKVGKRLEATTPACFLARQKTKFNDLEARFSGFRGRVRSIAAY